MGGKGILLLFLIFQRIAWEFYIVLDADFIPEELSTEYINVSDLFFGRNIKYHLDFFGTKS